MGLVVVLTAQGQQGPIHSFLNLLPKLAVIEVTRNILGHCCRLFSSARFYLGLFVVYSSTHFAGRL